MHDGSLGTRGCQNHLLQSNQSIISALSPPEGPSGTGGTARNAFETGKASTDGQMVVLEDEGITDIAAIVVAGKEKAVIKSFPPIMFPPESSLTASSPVKKSSAVSGPPFMSKSAPNIRTRVHRHSSSLGARLETTFGRTLPSETVNSKLRLRIPPSKSLFLILRIHTARVSDSPNSE
ncbi:hypothetical protein PM082_010627 [Marasmius tenuissimus]|nr:hypothetical protein PM082_010627 [Marasmius tenuissimus]